jgi:hypothetical protein
MHSPIDYFYYTTKIHDLLSNKASIHTASLWQLHWFPLSYDNTVCACILSGTPGYVRTPVMWLWNVIRIFGLFLGAYIFALCVCMILLAHAISDSQNMNYHDWVVSCFYSVLSGTCLVFYLRILGLYSNFYLTNIICHFLSALWSYDISLENTGIYVMCEIIDEKKVSRHMSIVKSSQSWPINNGYNRSWPDPYFRTPLSHPVSWSITSKTDTASYLFNHVTVLSVSQFVCHRW